MKKKIVFTFMVMSLSLSMIGCGGVAEPVNDSKVASESVSGEKSEDVISNNFESNIDVQPENEVKDDSDEPSNDGQVNSGQSEQIESEPEEDSVEEPKPTEVPMVEPNLDAFRVETLNYPFEGIYWSGRWGTYYFDGKDQIDYYGSDGMDKMPYVAEGNSFTTDYGETYEWWFEGDNLALSPDGGNYYECYTPLTEEQAIEKYPIIGGITEEPEEELSLDELRVENLTYDFEGVYWLTEYGSVKYFDGTYAYSYDDAGNEDKQEYAATDRTYEYVGAGYGFVWYMYENDFCFWLDGGEMGGDSGAMEMTYTPISKEKAIELFPVIGGEVVGETPATETACDFEDKYWLDDDGKYYHHYSNGKETREYFDGDTYHGTYVVNDNVITIDRDGFTVEFKFWIEDGKLYMEPAFTDGFGGETMVFTETTEDALTATTDSTDF